MYCQQQGRCPKNGAMRSNVLTTITFALVVLLGAEQGQAQIIEPSPTKDHPLLEVDVREFGYKKMNGSTPTRTFVDFTDNDHLAVGWLTLDNPSRARKLGPLVRRLAHLHALIINFNTGQKENQNEWPTPYIPVGFLAIPDGKILTCTADVLRLFSPSLELVREQKLPTDSACPPSLSVGREVSPSRRTLLLYSHPGNKLQMELLNADTFVILSKWTGGNLPSSTSDHWLVGDCGNPTELCLRKIDEQWHAFRPIGLDKQLSDHKRKITTFINDQTLVIQGGGVMAVTTVEGEILFLVRSPEKYSFESPVVSAGGARFAVIEDRIRGLRSEPLDMYPFQSNDRAIVYSVADRRSIYSVGLKGTSPWTPWDWHHNQLALSPEGIHLAILSDRVLRVYGLPNSNTEQH
jgi:hypothetical protein